jgi:hypothetical protein
MIRALERLLKKPMWIVSKEYLDKYDVRPGRIMLVVDGAAIRDGEVITI